MSRQDQSSRRLARWPRLFGCAIALICFASVAAAQSRIIRPQNSSNNSSSKRQRVATLRASDSPDGSRVALSADQSLNDYEAYRRGDRFYVKIPPADVPRAEVVRGRAFADVKVQRSVDSTVVSFRLQPGATAHVEQRGNKLDVVFTMPGARSSSTARPVARNDAGPAPPPDNKRRAATNSNSSRAGNSNASASKNGNSSSRQNPAAAKPSPTPKSIASPASSPAIAVVKPSPSPQPTKALTSTAQVRNSPSPAPTATTAAPVQGDAWNSFKERVRYWLLVAQLNPVPVGIGVALLLLLFGGVILQRRRAKATRRVRTRKSSAKADRAVAAAAPPAGAADIAQAEASTALAGAAVAPAAMASDSRQPLSEDVRHERVSRVSDEVKKLMTGGEYDENIIASNDRDTRQLVGAELLSTLVGRNVERRERARQAFMKHGYFDDATHDLRVAESANERAAAARRLSFVHDREATPHLIAALDDSSSDVRRAAVEALMDLRDPSAIAPLNSLMQTETDRKVPRSLIKHAIEACATSGHDEVSATPAVSSLPAAAAIPPAETEREVIEI
jgi:hypothetical protein